MSALVLLAPPLALLIWSGIALWNRADYYLARVAPIVAAEASVALQRPVTIGGITPGLTLERLWNIVRSPQDYGSLPVTVTDITVANKPDEARLAGRPLLASVPRVTILASVPRLLAGDYQEAVARIAVESPDVMIVRDTRGILNLAKILPPRPATEPPGPPFRTTVEIVGGKAYFRDYKAEFPVTALPAVNAFLIPRAFVDMTGSRVYRFTAEGRALPGSATVARFGGTLTAEGVSRRDEGTREDRAANGAPHILAQIDLTDADAAYWMAYLVKQAGFRIEAGRADASVNLYQPYFENGPEPPPVVGIEARFRGGRITATDLPRPLTAENLAGTAAFGEGALRLEAQGTVLNSAVAASGAIWDLPLPGASGRPQFSFAVNAPQLPVAQVLAYVVPKNGKDALPPGLAIGGVAAVAGNIVGRATGKMEDISAIGTVSGLNGSYPGYPAVRAAQSQVTFAGGTLRLSNFAAALGRDGGVTGEATVRLSGPVKGQGDAVFAAKVNNVDLSELTALKSLSANPDQRLRLAGIGDVEAVGRRVGGKLTAAANVSTRNLRVGDLPFPVANARVVAVDNQFGVTLARIESPAGIARVAGDVGAGGRLNLRFALGALDVKRLTLAFGQSGIDGIVSASGTVAGTARDPLIRIGRLEGLNLRYVAPAANGKNGGATRQFAVDALSAAGLILTRDRLMIAPTRPVVVRRFPAALAIGGTIAGLMPPTGGTFNPRLALTGRLENLDYGEVERQLGISVPAVGPVSAMVNRFSNLPVAPGSELAPWNQGRLVVRPMESLRLPLVRDLPPVSGSVLRSDFTATGTLNAPQVRGRAILGNLQIANYPLEGGSFAFSFTPQLTVLTDVTLQATVGTVTGKATLRGDGSIVGDFAAPSLNMESLNYLAGDLISLQGNIAASGTFRGTLNRPVVTAKIAAPTLTVAETTYTDFDVNEIRFTANLDAKRYILEIPSASLGRKETKVKAAKIYADFGSGELRGALDVTNGDVSVLLDSLRRSGISQTVGGAPFSRALARLPYPTEAKFDLNNLTASAKLVNGKLTDIRAQGALAARDLHVGGLTADALTARASVVGDKISVPSLVITRPGSTIRGQGTYDPNGNVQASLDSNDFSLDIIRSIPGLEDFPVRGALESLSLTANGPAKRPRVDLSLQGRDLLVITDKGAAQTDTGKILAEKGITIPLVRLEAFLEQDAKGRYSIVVPEDGFFVQRGAVELRASAELPFSYENDPTLGDRPIKVAARLPAVDLASLRALFEPAAVVPPNPEALTRPERAAANSAKAKAAAKEAATTDIGGTFAADVALSGTLRQPQLGGLVTLTNGRFRLAREPGSDRDKISPIRNFNARFVLDGNRINFDQFRVTLDGMNGQKGNYGTLDLMGSVSINTLENLRSLLNRGGTQNAPGIDGQYALTATMKDFQPAAENFFDLREAFRLKVNGGLKIAGKLLTPEISTPGAPLEISDADIRLPLLDPSVSEAPTEKPFNPRFDLAINISRKASLSGAIAKQAFLPFRFDLQGDARLTGPLYVASGPTAGALGLAVTSNLRTTGGFVQFPTALFKVEKNGIIQARFNTASSGLVAENVVATSRITARGNTPVSGGLSGADALFGAGTTTYKITLTLNGPLDNIIGDNGASASSDSASNAVAASGSVFTLTSDPPLAQKEIFGLVIGSSYLALGQQGKTEDAIRAFAAQALTSSYLPRYLSPITDSLASSLGLDTIGVEYTPNAPLRVRFLKRLSKPFDRVVLDVSRTFGQQDTTVQQTQPFRFSASYEIFQFRASDKIQPRIQLGVDSDEQGTITYFTRGTISF